MEEKLVGILNEMAVYLNVAQMKKLQEVLLRHLMSKNQHKEDIDNKEYLSLFLNAKRMEGCSERTLHYYSTTVDHMLNCISTPIRRITTEEIRDYLVAYQQNGNCSKVTVDNIRRNISSFFSWLEEEDYILKSPMRRIHKIKTRTVVKEVISDSFELFSRLQSSDTSKQGILYELATPYILNIWMILFRIAALSSPQSKEATRCSCSTRCV